MCIRDRSLLCVGGVGSGRYRKHGLDFQWFWFWFWFWLWFGFGFFFGCWLFRRRFFRWLFGNDLFFRHLEILRCNRGFRITSLVQLISQSADYRYQLDRPGGLNRIHYCFFFALQVSLGLSLRTIERCLLYTSDA